MKNTFNHMLRQKQKGMTLLEAIVSFLVVGFGLAMTVSMLQASNRYGVSAEYRAIIMREMQTIVEQMRANPLGFDGYFDGTPTPVTNCKDKPAPDSTCPLAKILQHKQVEDALKIAKKQKKDWKEELERRIPQAVVEDFKKDDESNKENGFIIAISWTLGKENKRDDSDEDNKTDKLKMSFSL